MSWLKDRIDPISSRQKSRPFRSGLILFGLIGLAIYMALSHNIPFINGKPGERLRADFAFANQIDPGQTPVRVRGVEVGMVDGVDPGPDPLRSSRIEMRITDEDLEIKEDARAEIRWRTLLGGNMYIDLEPGSKNAEPLGDGVIPIQRTANQTELDDLLQPYDGGTEQAQRDILKGLNDAIADPEAVRDAVEALPELETVGKGIEPLMGTQAGDLRRLVAATASTVDALGEDTGALRGLVTGARQTLGATNAEREALGQFLEESPPSLDETLATMTRLRTTLDHLDPLVDNLRPGSRELAPAANAARPALAEARGLLQDLRPVLADARPTFDDLRDTADAAVPFVNDLKPVVNRLNAETLPWLNETDDEINIKNYQAIGPFFSVLNMAAAEFDATGHRLHLSTPAATNSVLTLQQMQFFRSCKANAETPEMVVGCRRAAAAQAHGWFGRGGKK